MADRSALLLLVFSLATGCASATGSRGAGGWLEARGADAMDVLGVRVALGAGLGAYVRVTEWLQLGYVSKGPLERELPAPEGSERRAVPCFVFGTIGRYGGAWLESSQEVMIPGWSSRDDGSRLIQREPLAGYVSLDGRADRWRLAIGAGLHLLLAGVELEFRPVELFDLFAGVLGYDPSDDDLPVSPSVPGERPAT